MANYTWYKLVGNIPAIDNTSGGWFKKNHNKLRLAFDNVDDYEVITIFLCLSSEDLPKLFEITLSHKNVPIKTFRIETFASAIAKHQEIVASLRNTRDNKDYNE